MGGLFGGSSPPPPPPPPPLPTREDPEVEAERKRQLAAELRARGRASTILTGGQGDTAPPPVQRKTLLGQ